MKYLKEFNNWQPEEESVKKWESYLDKNLKINWEGDRKYVIIDDKAFYLNGFLFNKGRLTNKIFWDIKYGEGVENEEASLRRAIKNWIEKNREI